MSAPSHNNITDEEIREYFLLVDINNTGVVSGDKLDTLVRALGYVPRPGEIHNFGSLTLEEALVKIPRTRTVFSKNNILEALHILGIDENSAVNTTVLRNLFTSVGQPLTNQEVEELFSSLPVTNGLVLAKDLVEILGV
ncbi:hypothetical protein H696_03425 [Fonticula alba]|uniref:EF-hand domain-containing protein n=1 Tax=Fonticula alba TaxID=691883 RepID=A0A058Z6V3_FONAL|nr:hypothetical protein H696_03425 [Fonticula alba]KCV69960.1 hypothetical protein H696_03425 [Fonticula alba]|eukprot:XP_009495566.1 hypothetical protein H696_03425 [Fonticula alba]